MVVMVLKKMTEFRKVFPPWMAYLFWVFIAGMILSTGFRVFLLLLHYDLVETAPPSVIALSFYHGFSFDLRVCSGLILPPYLVWMFFWMTNLNVPKLPRITTWYFIAMSFFIIGFSMADFPYFDYYGSRLSNDILTWSDKPGLMVEILFADLAFIPTIVIGFLIGFLYWYFLFRLEKSCFSDHPVRVSFKTRLSLFLLTFCGMFLGLRGNYDLTEKPMITAQAFFSDFTFVNQLTLNAIFNLLDSYNVYEVNYTTDEIAIQKAQKYLNIKPGQYNSPIARKVEPDSIPSPKNVVLILMESMTAYKVGSYGITKGLTPFFDSLSAQSLFFPNTFSTGIHTRNGIYATMTGYPTLRGNRPMMSSLGNGKPYIGLPNTLKENGYSTVFFCTGKKDFDNMGGFLIFNGMEKVYSKADYPESEVFNKWGVTDYFMFNWALPVIRDLHDKNKPFFATFLTISAHEKTDLARPPGFEPKADNLVDQRFELADWSLKDFFDKASKEPWFKNTLFVLVADHGYKVNQLYDLPLGYHHVPLLFYSPDYVKPQKLTNLAGQTDIFPTTMGILNLPYINNSMGIDLRKETRPFMFFSSPTNTGCLDDSLYLILGGSGKDFLFHYQVNEQKNRIDDYPELVRQMKDYTLSMFQTTQFVVKNRLNGSVEELKP